MHRLLCLGEMSLLGPDGQRLSNAAAQPRRLALLALLGRSAPRAVSRERLLAWFWPDADEERGRRSLNQALYALRTELGSEEVILGQRDLRLNLDLVACDAAEFDAALESGRTEDAAGLYRGPFLDGFHLPSAAEFNQWVDEERRTLAQRFLDTLEQLAAAAERRGDHPGAVGWWRRAAGADPTSTPFALRLMRALAATGDRTAAIRHATIYHTIVQQQFELPSDPAVQALADELTRDLEAGVVVAPPEPAPGPSPVAQSAAAQAMPVVAAPPPAETREWPPAALPSSSPAPGRRRYLAGIGGAAAAVGAAVFLVLGSRGESLPVTDGPPIVAVLPYANQTNDSSFSLVGAMVTDWVTQGLAQTGLLRVMDTRTLLTAEEDLTALAARTGAAYVVTGQVYRRRDSLVFHTRITDGRTGLASLPVSPTAAPLPEPNAALEPLQDKVAGALAQLVDPRINNRTATSSQPPTWPAYNEFLLGMRDFGRDYDSNYAHFARAATVDSTYWQARLWAGISLANARRYPEADSVFQSVARRRDQLAPYDAASLDYFFGGFIRGDWEASYRGARRMAELAPVAGHALWAAGLTARMTHRPREALATFARADLTTGWGREWALRILGETARAHHILGRHAPELGATRRMLERAPDDGWARTSEVIALAAARRYQDLAHRVEAAMTLPEDPRNWEPFSPGNLLTRVATELRAHGAPADTARRYAEAAVQWYAAVTRAGIADTGHLLGHARAAYVAGRWAEARELYDRLVEANPGSAEFLGGAGAAAARTGDTARAVAMLARIDSLELPYPFGRRSRWMATVVAALGRRDEAIRLLGQSLREGLARWYEWHDHPDFVEYQGYPPFRSLIAPRG